MCPLWLHPSTVPLIVVAGWIVAFAVVVAPRSHVDTEFNWSGRSLREFCEQSEKSTLYDPGSVRRSSNHLRASLRCRHTHSP